VQGLKSLIEDGKIELEDDRNAMLVVGKKDLDLVLEEGEILVQGATIQ